MALEEAFQFVLSAYGLGSARVVQTHEASKRNDNLLIEDSTGARYILRRYRRNRNADRIDFQLRFQQHMCTRGFPTSEVVLANSGRRFVTFQGSHWSLFTYIEGREYDFTRRGQAAEAGRRLAQFHEIAETFGEREVTVPHNADVRQWRTEGTLELERLERIFGGQGVDNELQFLRHWVAKFTRELPLSWLNVLPVRWLHGDYHGRNIVYSGDEMVGLFDFDPVHRDFRVGDIGWALFRFGRESRGSFHMRPEVVRLFLSEYERSSPLKETEHEVLPLMVVGVPHNADYYEMLREDGEDVIIYLRENVRMMQSLQAEVSLLQDLLRRNEI